MGLIVTRKTECAIMMLMGLLFGSLYILFSLMFAKNCPVYWIGLVWIALAGGLVSARYRRSNFEYNANLAKKYSGPSFGPRRRTLPKWPFFVAFMAVAGIVCLSTGEIESYAKFSITISAVGNRAAEAAARAYNPEAYAVNEGMRLLVDRGYSAENCFVTASTPNGNAYGKKLVLSVGVKRELVPGYRFFSGKQYIQFEFQEMLNGPDALYKQFSLL
jgi:hypothetical protein